MKSFFKKIALVLALAMVVTMVPASVVSAADEPQMRETMRLYIGGDATESYSDTANAWVKYDKGTYTVAFASDNEAVATVGAKKGGVTAVGVGSANVTATFTDGSGNTVTKTCKVTVKKNAVEAGIGEGSAAKLAEGIVVGESFQPKVYRMDADGVTSWKGKDVITDSARFVSTNTEVFTVSKTSGKVTAVGVGTATLKVWAVQSEGATKDENGKVVEYLATTPVKEYPVNVIGAGISDAKQVSYNTVAVTCDTEAIAEEIAKDVTKLKASYVLGNNDITAFIKEAKVDGNDKKVVNVVLYNNLLKDTTYNFAYGEDVVSVVGVDLDVFERISIATSSVPYGDYKALTVNFYNAAGIMVAQKLTTDGTLNLSAPDNTDYVIDGSQIYFFAAGKEAQVTVSYNMGYDNDGNKIKDLEDTAVVVSYDAAATSGSNITGWSVDNKGSWTTDTINLAVTDVSKTLLFKFNVTQLDNTVKEFISDGTGVAYNGFASYEYTSTNDAIVLVDTVGGTIYPVSAGVAQIIVKGVDWAGNKTTIGVCRINVAANRAFQNFTIAASKTKLSSSADDKVYITSNATDQFGVAVVPSVYNVKLLSVIDGVTVKVNTGTSESPNYVALTKDGVDVRTTASFNNLPAFEFQATGTTVTAVRNVQIAITATQWDPWATYTKAITLQVKAAAATSSAYVLNLGKDSIDLNLAGRPGWANGIWYYQSSISLEGNDSQGFKVENIAMTPNTDKPNATTSPAYSYTVHKGNTLITISGDTFSVYSDSTESATVSGVAELVTIPQGTGTYTVRVYRQEKASDPVRLIATKNIVVTDSSVAITVTQNNNNLSSADAATKETLIAALADRLSFKRGNDDVALKIVDVNYRQVDNKLYVTSVKVNEEYGIETYYPFTANKSTHSWDVTVGKVFNVQ